MRSNTKQSELRGSSYRKQIEKVSNTLGEFERAVGNSKKYFKLVSFQWEETKFIPNMKQIRLYDVNLNFKGVGLY